MYMYTEMHEVRIVYRLYKHHYDTTLISSLYYYHALVFILSSSLILTMFVSYEYHIHNAIETS